MLYENEISLPDEVEMIKSEDEPEYEWVYWTISWLIKIYWWLRTNGVLSEGFFFLSWICLLRLKVYCYYDINETHAVSFNTRARRSEPYADDARGELQVEIRVSSGEVKCCSLPQDEL